MSDNERNRNITYKYLDAIADKIELLSIHDYININSIRIIIIDELIKNDPNIFYIIYSKLLSYKKDNVKLSNYLNSLVGVSSIDICIENSIENNIHKHLLLIEDIRKYCIDEKIDFMYSGYLNVVKSYVVAAYENFIILTINDLKKDIITNPQTNFDLVKGILDLGFHSPIFKFIKKQYEASKIS